MNHVHAMANILGASCALAMATNVVLSIRVGIPLVDFGLSLGVCGSIALVSFAVALKTRTTNPEA